MAKMHALECSLHHCNANAVPDKAHPLKQESNQHFSRNTFWIWNIDTPAYLDTFENTLVIKMYAYLSVFKKCCLKLCSFEASFRVQCWLVNLHDFNSKLTPHFSVHSQSYEITLDKVNNPVCSCTVSCFSIDFCSIFIYIDTIQYVDNYIYICIYNEK